MSESIQERLKDACDGHPYAKIYWPHRLLHDAIDHIDNLEEKYKALVIAFDDKHGTPCSQVRLQHRIEELEDTLRFYADPANWKPDFRTSECNALNDEGQKAREILGEDK